MNPITVVLGLLLIAGWLLYCYLPRQPISSGPARPPRKDVDRQRTVVVSPRPSRLQQAIYDIRLRAVMAQSAPKPLGRHRAESVGTAGRPARELIGAAR